MSDYNAVKQALASGADPAMLCATCPWDRNCVSPPEMTAGDIEKKMTEASAQDQVAMLAARANGDTGAFPTATLVTAAIYAGKDTALQACPVLAVRLRGGDGRRLAETVRAAMQSWVES
jgi:hypothetical protein